MTWTQAILKVNMLDSGHYICAFTDFDDGLRAKLSISDGRGLEVQFTLNEGQVLRLKKEVERLHDMIRRYGGGK